MSAGVSPWPASRAHGEVGVRPLRLRDSSAWVQSRRRNRDWLERWEGAPQTQAALSWDELHTPATYSAMLRKLRKEARAGRVFPFAVTYGGRLVGQVTVGNVVRGAWDNGHLGYWVDSDVAGRGVMPTAVALVVDHMFGPAGLHRIEVDVRPENAASLRVVEKLGFRPEGRHERYLYINGAWRDHLCFALVQDDVPEGVLSRWLSSRPN